MSSPEGVADAAGGGGNRWKVCAALFSADGRLDGEVPVDGGGGVVRGIRASDVGFLGMQRCRVPVARAGRGQDAGGEAQDGEAASRGLVVI